MILPLPNSSPHSNFRACSVLTLVASGFMGTGCERETPPQTVVQTEAATAVSPEKKSEALTAGLRLNQMQVIGTHNSYHIAPDILTYSLFDARAEALDYTHQPMTAQLDAGIRGFELDVFVDDAGGRYAHPISIVGH